MKKIAPLVLGLVLICLTSGCVTNSRESGKRTNILFGLVDYKRDYQRSGYIYDPTDAGVLDNAVVTANPSGLVGGYSEAVYGKKLTILWGLGGTYNWE